MLLKQLSQGMAQQNEFTHLISGTDDATSIDFTKRIVDIQSLDKVKEQMHKQLSEKDKALEVERQQKLQMEQLVREMEQKLVQGGTSSEEEKQKEYRKIML